jgi:3-methyl-2-oxobutanoate hydroxymethyltransferase
MEGGQEIRESIERILSAGIPVMGHLGLTPQSINKFGGYGLRAKSEAEAQRLLSDAKMLQEIGCFSLVLEKIPSALAAQVSQSLTIPTIGIGAGSDTDGQVLVLQDMLALNQGFKPKFLRHFGSFAEPIKDSIGAYVAAVNSKRLANFASNRREQLRLRRQQTKR